jgi:hypothetical protein
MSGALPSLPQYAFMAWCSVKAQGQLYLYLTSCVIYMTPFFLLDLITVMIFVEWYILNYGASHYAFYFPSCSCFPSPKFKIFCSTLHSQTTLRTEISFYTDTKQRLKFMSYSAFRFQFHMDTYFLLFGFPRSSPLLINMYVSRRLKMTHVIR